MSTEALKSLTVEGLRGATTKFVLDFVPKKKLTVLYGENASGKSTLCDALELLGHGKVSSLDDRGLGTTRRFWPSIGKTAKDIKVTLVTASQSHTATVGTSSVLLTPPNGGPKVEVLRRKQVLSLVLAGETERFALVGRFIDVVGVEESENRLKTAWNDAKAARATAQTRLGENLATLEGFWKQRPKGSADAVSWARSESEEFDLEAVRLSASAVSAMVNRFDDVESRVGELRASRIGRAEASELHAEASARLNELAGSSRGATEVEFLESARALLSSHTPTETCPLCGSAEHVAGLADEVSRRLEALAEISSATAAETGARQRVVAAESQESEIRAALGVAVAEWSVASTGAAVPDDIRERASAFPMSIEDEWDGWLASGTEQKAAWMEFVQETSGREQFIGALRAALRQFDANKVDEEELSKLVPALEKAHKVAMDERRDFVDGILAEIAQDVGELYEKVHPTEGLDKISLQLNPSQRRALTMQADFEGHANQPPQAYFSDSHLDTLGLCIFLALAKRESPEETILVLDDVLGSVDEPHVDRLIEMLYEVALNFRHCVLTTHYGPWKHKLRWGWLQNGQCQFVELGPWAHPAGMCLSSAMPDLERLKALLAESVPDRQLVCAKAGVILEAALNFLTELYECAVPRKREDRYTLGDLLPNVRGKLREALRVECLTGEAADGTGVYTTVALAPILDRLQQIAEVRNVIGAHFKEISFELLDNEAIEFGSLVVELMDALTDAEAGWPKSDKSGSYWATAGETRRLHPLRRPS